MTNQVLWFGISDSGVFVYDPTIQPALPERIILFDVERKSLALYENALAKPKLRKLQDVAAIDEAREKYKEWRYFYSSTLPKIFYGPPTEFPLSQLEERHKQFLKLREKPFLGTKERSTHLPIRAPKCWSCHAPLDSTINLECVACGWILCACGACGCGRTRERFTEDFDDEPF
jgi:hypothetical protein